MFFRFLLLIFFLLVFGCIPLPPPENNDCNIDFFDIAMREDYLFEGTLLACHRPNPNDLVLHEQNAEVNFVSYENDILKFRLITESNLLSQDTTLAYSAFCYEGDDDPNSSDEELFIWVYNNIDTVGYFRRSLSKFSFYFDSDIFDDKCFSYSTDLYFSGILVD